MEEKIELSAWKKWYLRKGKEYYRNYYQKKDRLIYFRNWCEKNRKHLNEYYRNYYQDPTKKIIRNARNAANRAILKNEIKKQNHCTNCHSKNNLEKHHSDYSNSLSIIWLCRKCHRKLHLAIKNKQLA